MPANKKPTTNSATKTKETATPVKEVEVEEIKETVSDTKESENEALKKQIEDMKAQMAYLMGQMSTEKAKPTVKERNIPFINMTPGTLVLKGTQVWKIEGQFVQRSFLEREARVIINNMRNAVTSGVVYIADAQFVEDNDLTEVYHYILSNEQLKTLFQNKPEYIIELYKNTPEQQQEIIIKMVMDKKLSGQPVDGNILVELGKLSGKDLVGIEPETEE